MRTTTTLGLLAALSACAPTPPPPITPDTPWGPTAIIQSCDALDGLERMECLLEPRRNATTAARRFQANVRRDIYVMALTNNWALGGLHPEVALAALEGAAKRDEAREACDAAGKMIGDPVRLWRVNTARCPA